MSAAKRTGGGDKPVRKSKRSFGPILRDARQQRRVALEDVARGTRLARRYLLALENESLDELPGGPYNRAYLRTYAEYLGLDADSLVRDYDRESQAQCEAGRLVAEPDAVAAMRAVVQRRESQKTGGAIAVRTTARVVIVTGAALAVLVGAMWLGARHFTRSAEISPATVTNPSAVLGSEAGKELVEAKAMAPEPAPRTEPKAPQSDQKPAAGVQGITSGGTPPAGAAPTAGAAPPAKPSAKPAPPAKPAPSAEVAPPAETPPATSLSVNDSGVGTDVVGRQLVGRADTFAVGTRVAFWMMVTGGRRGDTVRHVWMHQGQKVSTFKLSIGGANWRTQSRRTLAPGGEGDWVVEAHDASGRVLARHTFRCEP
jgi:cytoskeletal protein RodZ